jgi:hypothetical protein
VCCSVSQCVAVRYSVQSFTECLQCVCSVFAVCLQCVCSVFVVCLQCVCSVFAVWLQCDSVCLQCVCGVSKRIAVCLQCVEVDLLLLVSVVPPLCATVLSLLPASQCFSVCTVCCSFFLNVLGAYE